MPAPYKGTLPTPYPLGMVAPGEVPSPAIAGGPDYDMNAYNMAYGMRSPMVQGHYTDQFKLPNHPTFSTGSIYSQPGREGGVWGNMAGRDYFIASPTNRANMSRPDLEAYFRRVEPKAVLYYGDK